jgi:hypothetical protein
MSSHCLFHSYSVLGLWWLTPLSTIFQLYRGSFIDGENQSTHRKWPTCRKPFANFITYSCIKYTSSWKAKPTKNTTNIWFVNQVSDADSWEPLILWPCHILFSDIIKKLPISSKMLFAKGNIDIICFWNPIEVTDPELLQKNYSKAHKKHHKYLVCKPSERCRLLGASYFMALSHFIQRPGNSWQNLIWPCFLYKAWHVSSTNKPEYEWNRQCDDMFLPPTKLSMSGIDSVMTCFFYQQTWVWVE